MMRRFAALLVAFLLALPAGANLIIQSGARGAPAQSGGGGAAPAWVTNSLASWPDGTWTRISGSSPDLGLSATNTVRDVKTVDPSDSRFQGIIKNWSGGWLAPDYGTYGSFGIGIGGGHGSNTGYTGSDVFRFDLGTRTWTEIHARQETTLDTTFGEYPDGSTAAMHTYFTWVATPALPGHPSGMLLIPRSSASSSLNTPAAVVPYARGMDLATGVWTRYDQIPGGHVAGDNDSWTEACASVWDTTRNKMWFWAMSNPQAESNFAALDPLASSGSQWTETRPTNPNGGHGWSSNGIEQVLVHDTVRDIIITLDFRATGTIKYLFPGSPGTYNTTGTTAFPITETGTAPPKGEGRGFAWSTLCNCAYFWTGATTDTVYQLKYASGVVGSQGVAGNLTYNWSMVTSGANTVTPATQDDNDAKVYNRFRIVRYGDVEFAVTVTSVDGPVYAFRISSNQAANEPAFQQLLDASSDVRLAA